MAYAKLFRDYHVGLGTAYTHLRIRTLVAYLISEHQGSRLVNFAEPSRYPSHGLQRCRAVGRFMLSWMVASTDLRGSNMTWLTIHTSCQDGCSYGVFEPPSFSGTACGLSTRQEPQNSSRPGVPGRRSGSSCPAFGGGPTKTRPPCQLSSKWNGGLSWACSRRLPAIKLASLFACQVSLLLVLWW